MKLRYDIKKIENTKGFSENSIMTSSKKVNFFNLGPENDYNNFLDKKTKASIENVFFNEMKELNYI